MKVVRPTKNIQTQGYSANHRAYDFAGFNLPNEVRAGMDGVVIERVDLYTTNWINNGQLTTKDYGNYIKIKHADGSLELHAHLEKGSSFNINTPVIAGQVVARIGNTGNSTGPHLHSEYRTSENVNIAVEFIDAPMPQPPIDDKRPYWFDLLSPTEFDTTGWEQLTQAQIDQWVSDLYVRKVGNGKWDVICGLAGLPTSSTSQQVYDKIKGQGNTIGLKNEILEVLKKY